MARSVSGSARLLSARLEERGERVSPRQLERWRQHGLIPRVRQRGAGRGRGSTVELGEEVIDQALDASRLVRRYRTLPGAVLAMFGEGRYKVEKPELDGAYLTYLGTLAAKLLASSPAGSVQTAASAIGSRVGGKAARRADHADIRGRLKRMREARFEPLAWMLTSLYEDVALIFLAGRPTSAFALTELLRATGVGAIATEPPPGQPPLVSSLPELTEQLAEMSAPALADLVGRTSLEDLEHARDYLTSLHAFARAWVPPIRDLFPDGFGFVAVLATTPIAVALATPVVARLDAQLSGELVKSQSLFRASTESIM